MKFLRSIGLAALLMVGASSASADIDVSRTTETGSVRSTIGFGTGDAINDISKKIKSCPTMSVTFFQATAAQVTLYEADPDDDTFAKVEASTLAIAYTATSTSSFTFRPGKQFVRFVVDTVETSGTSIAVVNCINEVAVREESVFEGHFDIAGGMNDAVPGTSTCVLTAGNTEIVANFACTTPHTTIGDGRAMLITGMHAQYAIADSSTVRGCRHCLSVDGGNSCVTGTTINIPDDDAASRALGDTVSVDMNVYIPSGSLVQTLIGNGSGCNAGDVPGTNCYCSGDLEYKLNIRGAYL